MKYNQINQLIKGREYVIRSINADIEELKAEDIRFLDHDEEEYDCSLCKCQISFLDGKPPLTYDDLKAKHKELMDAEPMRLLRIERNKRLEQTDYRFKPDYKNKSNTHKRIWEEYRQYLRDLPQKATPALDDKGDLSFNFMDEPDDNKIIPDEKDDPIPITNEDLLSENLKMKEQVNELEKKLNKLLLTMG